MFHMLFIGAFYAVELLLSDRFYLNVCVIAASTTRQLWSQPTGDISVLGLQTP
jgi:hypothetical protein